MIYLKLQFIEMKNRLWAKHLGFSLGTHARYPEMPPLKGGGCGKGKMCVHPLQIVQ